MAPSRTSQGPPPPDKGYHSGQAGRDRVASDLVAGIVARPDRWIGCDAASVQQGVKHITAAVLPPVFSWSHTMSTRTPTTPCTHHATLGPVAPTACIIGRWGGRAPEQRPYSRKFTLGGAEEDGRKRGHEPQGDVGDPHGAEHPEGLAQSDNGSPSANTSIRNTDGRRRVRTGSFCRGARPTWGRRAIAIPAPEGQCDPRGKRRKCYPCGVRGLGSGAAERAEGGSLATMVRRLFWRPDKERANEAGLRAPRCRKEARPGSASTPRFGSGTCPLRRPRSVPVLAACSDLQRRPARATLD